MPLCSLTTQSDEYTAAEQDIQDKLQTDGAKESVGTIYFKVIFDSVGCSITSSLDSQPETVRLLGDVTK